jgi:PAS domain S-box-containing protein
MNGRCFFTGRRRCQIYLGKNLYSDIESKKPILAGIVVFVTVMVLTQYLTYQRYLISEENALQKATREADIVRDRLTTSLSFSLSATKTLAFLVEKYGVPDDFDAVAQGILESNRYIDALELTKEGTITHVYPLAGNEGVIGYDVLSEPSTRSEAIKARDRKQLFFAGPFRLKQGGIGVVGRLPIFKDRTFFGFSVVIIRLATLFTAAGIDSAQNKEFLYQLSKINPTTKREEFFLPVDLPHKNRHVVSMEVPDGEWKIYVMAKDGNSTFINILIFGLLGLMLSVTAGIFSWYLVRQPQKLNSLVRKKTVQFVSEKNLSEYIINALPGIFYFYDKTGKFIRWNKNFEIVSGYSSEEIKNMHPLDFFEGPETMLLEEKINQVFAVGQADMTAHFCTKHKKKIPYYFNGRKVIYNHVEYLIGMGIDISDRLEAENKLRERTDEIQRLTAHLERAQEEERTRIAREIHDELGQQLTGLKMDASWISKNLSGGENVIQPKLSVMIALIDETVKTVRRISSELRPGILDDLGLIPALEWQSQEFEKRTGINARFIAEVDTFNPDRNVSTNIFRVYQEALTNIARHANATRVNTSVVRNNGTFTLVVEDNGQGMDKTDTSKGTLGLIGMRERALLFGGELSIESEKQKGTTIKLTVPVQSYEENA